MSKTFKPKNSKRRFAAFGLGAVLFCTVGLTAACDASSSSSTDDEQEQAAKIDTQVLKNGNFEFYDDKDGKYLISSPNNWSAGSAGNSSDSMSGIINTDYEKWQAFTDDTLPATLKANNELKSDDENKVDYNGMMPDDLPFKNTHDADDKEFEVAAEDYISNPYTHEYSWDDEGNLIDLSGNIVTTYEDDDGNVFLDEDKTQPLETSVLMIHNYVDDDNYGSQKYYSSSTSLSLEANTAAKISVWVKTDELYYGGNNDTRTKVEDSRGAYIKVTQSVGGSTVDSFFIKNIDTSVINPDGDNNGWVEYTVYVQACAYAETSISITVGLGENSMYTVEGYAFFDDISFTKYRNLEMLIEDCGYENDVDFFEAVEDTTCTLLSDKNEKIYRTDKFTYSDENGEHVISNNYCGDFIYFIDLATSSSLQNIVLNDSNAKAGLTVDSNGYVNSKSTAYSRFDLGVLDNGAGNAYLPRELASAGKSVNTSEDILANLTLSSTDESWKNAFNGSVYKNRLVPALESALTLPYADNEMSALLMFSAQGAAYETQITHSSFKVFGSNNSNETDTQYKIVSFWVKTSDLNGNTAATVTVTDVNDKENSASFTLDSTTVSAVSIDNNDDVYSGWVQCFVLVANDLEEDKDFKITVNFGLTDIKDTNFTSYHNGWVAITNINVLSVDEDAFAYANNSSYAATLTFSEKSSSVNNAFDTEAGGGYGIESDIVNPANYTGVNGNSVYVGGASSSNGYDDVNRNDFAGLINKDYVENYANCAWFTSLTQAITNLDTDNFWDKVAGPYSVQPLLIVNAARTVADEPAGVYNYGFIGKNSSVSSSSYTAISVRVKVSAGAVATVYLVDSDKEVMSYAFPGYSFWYDDEGNVLKGEPDENWTDSEQKANILYTLRADGLYEADGKLYANFYNLSKYYYNESLRYFDENGEAVLFDDLKGDENYYLSATDRSELAPHYLVTDSKTRVYSYVSGTETNGNLIYNYVVNDKADTSLTVYGFDKSYARYDTTNFTSTPYSFTIDGRATNPDAADVVDKWITVTFYVHTGSESKDYRLELWSGYRNEANTDGVQQNSYVLFDYSYASIDESGYSSLLGYYTDRIIEDYKSNLSGPFASNGENIAYYENLAGEGGKSDVYKYDAKYFTYSLYDSSAYVPFNETVADENETGYDYLYSDYKESLAYLKIEDVKAENGLENTDPTMAMFIDYSAVDQSISIGTADDDDEEEDSVTTTDNTNLALLISSICMVVAILIAIAAVVIKDFLKKAKKKKTVGKNTYNFSKNKRYVRKYVKANGEINESENGESNADSADETVEAEETQNGEETAESVKDEEQSGGNDENSDK